MKDLSQRNETDFLSRLKWLMGFRVLFAFLLLGSTILVQISQSVSLRSPALMILYAIIGAVFILSIGYRLIINRVKRKRILAYVQISIDTVVVSFIIFITGGFASIFSFLYLVVIIYASILLFRKGSLIIASISSIQYGVMIDLEYYHILKPFGVDETFIAANYAWNPVFYKIIVTLAACFAVALLASFLAERERKTKYALLTLEDHVKRVERMAAIGEMAAGLAHEIKNPLASLSGSIQMIKDSIHQDPEHDKLMQIIFREADRLNDLINSFLLFAKPPTGKAEAIELSRALSETIALFEKDHACRGRIVIRKELIQNTWITMDPGHLRQVAWNLLLNAAEAIECEGIIQVKMVHQKNKHIGIMIMDNGSGMSEETIKSIFDPFFTTKPNGTGLGLSIVHRIVETSGGRLDVESSVHKGTTFTLNLKEMDPPPAASISI